MIKIYRHFFNKNKLLKKCLYFCYLFLISFLSWNYYGIIFFAFGHELFKHLDVVVNKNNKGTLYKTIILLAAWEFGALFWMLNIDKGLFAILSHLIFTLLAFIFIFFILKKMKSMKLLFFIFLMLFLEFCQNNISISFPWLTIGNVFSNQVSIIQWYEYTSVYGGSFWFLIVSYFLFFSVKKKKKYLIVTTILLFFSPIIFSYTLLKNPDKKEGNMKVMVYNNEFYIKKNNSEIAYYIYNNIKKTKNIHSLILPEYTFKGIRIDNFNKTLVFSFFKKLMKESNIKNIYFGTSLYKRGEKIANGSIFMTKDKVFFKVKRKLVPYTEFLPVFLHKYFKKTFFNPNMKDTEKQIINTKKILPLICYEGFFSTYVKTKIKNCDIIYLISSEEFLKNSFFGRKQYDNIIKIRCIENRIPLIKCTSFGFSYFINSYGIIKQKNRNEFTIFSLPLKN